ncbi:unnamed protein product, partial [Heterosigma akashiwo]
MDEDDESPGARHSLYQDEEEDKPIKATIFLLSVFAGFWVALMVFAEDALDTAGINQIVTAQNGSSDSTFNFMKALAFLGSEYAI